MISAIRRILGLVLVIDGARSYASPEGYLRQLQFGPPLVDDILEYFAENPSLTRKVAVVEIAVGAWLTLG